MKIQNRRSLPSVVLLVFLTLNLTCLAEDMLTLNGQKDAIDVSRHFSYIYDPDQIFTVEQLRTAPGEFTLNQKSRLDFGLVKGDLWLRLEFRVEMPPEDESRPWFLDLGMVHPNTVDFYHYVDDKKIREFHGGNIYPFRNRDTDNTSWIFSVPMHAGKHLILIQLNSYAMIQGQAFLEQAGPMYKKSGVNQMVYGFLFGIFGLVIVHNLVAYLVSREPAFLFGTGVMVSFLFFEISFSGLGFQYFWPEHPELNSFMIRFPLGLTFAMVGGFVSSYMRLASWTPLLARCLNICSALVALMVIFPVFRYVPALAFCLIFMVPVLCIWTAISAFRRQLVGSIFLLVGFLIFAFFICLTFLSSLGLLPNSSIILTYFDIGMLMMVIIMSAGVANKFNEDRLAVRVSKRSTVAKNLFLANMSHEIRTPMNGVTGMLTLLLRGELSDRQLQYATMARSSANSLLTVINDILDFTKIEAGKLTLEKLDFNIISVLEETVESMAYQAQQKGLELVLDVTGINCPFVNGDAGRIRQVVTNLINNAIKFTGSGAVIVKARMLSDAEEHELYCSITDTGMGIEQQNIDSLFDSFSQVDASTTREYGGTGLGLAIAKHLCVMMGGAIGVKSNVGKGSIFWFQVVLARHEGPTTTPIDPSLNHISILIAGSNQVVTDVLTVQLSIWGANVSDVSTTEEAFSYLRSHQDVVVFIDTRMSPSGYQLAEDIVAGQDVSISKIFLMAPFDACRLPANFKGKAACISKPITQANLRTHLLAGSPALETVAETTAPKPREVMLLLVEDNEINREVALGMLEDMGFEADIAENGLEAMECLKKSGQRYDLVLMDCQMPVMDGYKATEEIRLGNAGEAVQHIPIIAMTANAMKGDAEKCLQVGMDDYIPKPVDPDLLERKLNQWLNLP